MLCLICHEKYKFTKSASMGLHYLSRPMALMISKNKLLDIIVLQKKENM